MPDPFRDDSALVARIEHLERALAETREELARELAAAPENGSAYTRRLQEQNDELHRDCQQLEAEAVGLQRALAVLKAAK